MNRQVQDAFVCGWAGVNVLYEHTLVSKFKHACNESTFRNLWTQTN